jgi:hypothetical protein
MRRGKRSAILCVVLASVAALAAAAAPLSPAPASRPAKPAANEPRLLPSEANKPFLHSSSGFVFPFNVGAFRRAGIYALDEGGRNIAVGYSDPSLKIIMTVSVYPHYGFAGQVHFGQIKGDVVKAKPKATKLQDGPVTIEQGPAKHQGWHARFAYIGELSGVEQVLMSDLYLFTHGASFVKMRIVYPATEQKNASPRVDLFLQTLTFPAEPPATRPAAK